MKETNQDWDWQVSGKHGFSLGDWKEVFARRHFIQALVRKDFVLNYRQTILGPLWIFFNPLLTLLIYVLVFGKLIPLPIGKSTPPVLFYFSGIILWNFFSDSFLSISNTFREHQTLYSKVYFPRIIMPLATLYTNFMRFLIQLALLVALLLYYAIANGQQVDPFAFIISVPAACLGVVLISLGCGLIAAILTAKYRDLFNIISIFIRLLMFVTPVLYSLSTVREDFKWVVQINPLTPLFELFRSFISTGHEISYTYLAYSYGFGLLVLTIALYYFHTRSSRLIDIA